MIPDFLVISAVFLVGITSVYILISRDWRKSIAIFSLQYIGIFLLVFASMSVELAFAKMITGWMVAAILFIAMSGGAEIWREHVRSINFDTVFRVTAAAIIALAIASLVNISGGWLSMISTPIRWGSFILITIGLLQLSLTTHPLRVIMGLLTALSGFEILYSVVETSILVTGLLAGINLGLALICAYLLFAPAMETTE